MSSPPPPPHAWVVLVVLNLLSGLFSGLNLGLMSLTVEDLNIVIRSSPDAKQVKYAKRILPLRRRGNLLLCTLLIGNTVVNVMLSVLTDPIWVWLFGSGTLGTVFGLALPSALIVVFGEIVPQSVCSRYALKVGSLTLPLTYVFVVLILPFSLPISVLLDKVLGKEITAVFTRQGLVELVRLNLESKDHFKQNDLELADGKVILGALQYRDRTVGDVMTPLAQCFSLPLGSTLDQPTFLSLLTRGHTRVPVYEGEKTNIVSILLCKDLLGIGFERKLPLASALASFPGTSRVHRVGVDTKLDVALDMCKKEHAHMLVVMEAGYSSREGEAPSGLFAAVSRRFSAAPPAEVGPARAVGIVTLEDFIEEILQEEIIDETDVYVDNAVELSELSGSTSRAASGRSLAEVSTGSGKSVQLRETSRGLRRVNSKMYDTAALLKRVKTRDREQAAASPVSADSRADSPAAQPVEPPAAAESADS